MQKSSTNNERNVYLIQIHPRQTDQSPYQIEKKWIFQLEKENFQTLKHVYIPRLVFLNINLSISIR